MRCAGAPRPVCRWWDWCWAASGGGLSALARTILPGGLAAALVAALPFLLTGFMHLDGFMDASDAMLSWREREARLKILKDVHVGSFSVVALGLLFMFQFGACLSLKALFPLLLIPLISRAGSALSVMLIRPLGHSQYAAAGEDFPAGAPRPWR